MRSVGHPWRCGCALLLVAARLFRSVALVVGRWLIGSSCRRWEHPATFIFSLCVLALFQGVLSAVLLLVKFGSAIQRENILYSYAVFFCVPGKIQTFFIPPLCYNVNYLTEITLVNTSGHYKFSLLFQFVVPLSNQLISHALRDIKRFCHVLRC